MFPALQDELGKLNAKFQLAFTDELNGRYPILDGALDLTEYLTSPLKIMWLMKEPYDEEGGAGGGWSFPVACKQDEFIRGLVLGAPRPTWQPVIYTTFGILNNCQRSDMNSIQEDPSMMHILRKIAWVNIQKLPSKGVTRTNINDIIHSYTQHRHLLLRQIELLKPDVIICAGTFRIIQHDFRLVNPTVIPGIHYYIKDKMLVIDAYHPAQTTIKRDLYVNSIVTTVQGFRCTFK